MQGYYENHRDDMTNAHAWYARDNRFAPHFHNSVELAYVLEGEIIATLDGVERRVGPRGMVISSSYVVHSYETPEASHIVVAIIPMTEVPSVRQLLSKQAFASPVCEDDERHTLGSLMELLAACGYGGHITRKGLCYTLLGMLIDRVGLVEARPNSRTAFIREVLDYLQQHHTDPLSVESVAAQFGYSRSRFSYLFHAHLGYTLMDYVAAVRCRHAAQLLRETDMPVSGVAMSVGFESLRTFHRAFKKQYDMTPHRYARAGFDENTG
ncbi:AraC family transcriptional regulator [Eubacteriales bacterium OttesenSCG-928-A19]|nr:AraC family transcriptional regulator [Eubacteriales bacterium OttesenSCG-928-A19]